MAYKARLFVYFVLLALLAIPFAGLQAQDALPDLGGQTITVAVENAYIPFNFIDPDTGEALGWDYDVLNEMCVRLNCVPDFVQTSWDGMILAVSNGEYDMAADGITIKVETFDPPPDCPIIVTLLGLPPKTEIFSFTHSRAATKSIIPATPAFSNFDEPFIPPRSI